jgi:hypothetical protein
MADTIWQTLGGLLSDAAMKTALTGYEMVNPPASLPSSQRVYLDTVLHNSKSKITEKDFSPNELALISKIIQEKQLSNPSQTRGYIEYKDYDKFLPETEKTAKAGVFAGEKNPYENIRTTLGQFRYQYLPDQNRIFVIDNYDFNPVEAYKDDSKGEYIGKDMSLGRMLRSYGERKVPQGQGRQVLLEIPGLLGKPKK